ncbi:MAG: hypothetical protein H6978_16790, partial [Gammaproteobacteria bacterium]|nr:hypothetical protein [Gammaproteobacteria bacterium]
KRVRIPAIAAVVLGILTAAVVYDYNSLLTTIGVIAALWILGAALLEPIQRLRNPNLPRLSGAMWGMVIAHVGVGLFVLGVTVTSSFNVEDDLAARPGETLNVAGYDFNFVGLKEVRGPNYDALEGEFEVRRNGDYVTTLRPQKRVYNVRREAMTEASIDARITRDLFIALGEDLGADRWSLRIQYKPLISLLWLGALTMAVGGFVASMDRRYRGATADARNDVPAGTAPSAPIG